MPKNIPQPTNSPDQDQRSDKKQRSNVNEPLSGSKKVKNQNHSRQKNGEG